MEDISIDWSRSTDGLEFRGDFGNSRAIRRRAAYAICMPTGFSASSNEGRDPPSRENISSYEVELVMLSHPVIAEAAAFPVRSEFA